MLSIPKNQARSVWLAPMSGATDAPFRRQVAKFGADAVVSEMTASAELVKARPDVVRRTHRHEGNCPWIVQLAGRRPEDMRAAAHYLAEAGVDQIDINMGCPSRQVTGGLSGSALMREPKLAESIIRATLEGAGATPVSLKMRLGWDHDLLNAPEIGRIAEDLGVVQLTVHGRTRCQFYKGEADWARIGETVQAVSVPVLANGDIATVGTARRALAASGAAGVMIGRAAIGRPWLVGQIARELAGEVVSAPSLGLRRQTLIDQLADAVELYGERQGVRITRKHLSAAIVDAPLQISPPARRALQSQLCQIDRHTALVDALMETFDGELVQEAA